MDASGYVTQAFEAGELSSSEMQNYNVLFLTAFQDDLSMDEINDIIDFVSNGGGLIFLGDCWANTTINNLLSTFGIQFNQGGVKKNGATGFDVGNPVISNFTDHDSVAGFPKFKMNYGGAFTITSPAMSIAVSDIDTWLDIDNDDNKDSNEPAGPLVIIAAAEYGQGKMLCISDNSLHDDYISWDTSNSDLVLGALSWFTENVNQTLNAYYRDSDSEGYGDPDTTQEDISQPSGYVTDSTDCNDNDSGIHPEATESCNGVDDNCDNIVDESCNIAPGKSNLTSPSGIIEEETTPTLTWNQVTNATWYKIFVGASSEEKIHVQWYDAADICSGGSCSVVIETELLSGDYEWYVKSWNDYGKDWSEGMSFSVGE